jgi:hypothetical protein
MKQSNFTCSPLTVTSARSSISIGINLFEYHAIELQNVSQQSDPKSDPEYRRIIAVKRLKRLVMSDSTSPPKRRKFRASDLCKTTLPRRDFNHAWFYRTIYLCQDIVILRCQSLMLKCLAGKVIDKIERSEDSSQRAEVNVTTKSRYAENLQQTSRRRGTRYEDGKIEKLIASQKRASPGVVIQYIPKCIKTQLICFFRKRQRHRHVHQPFFYLVEPPLSDFSLSVAGTGLGRWIDGFFGPYLPHSSYIGIHFSGSMLARFPCTRVTKSEGLPGFFCSASAASPRNAPRSMAPENRRLTVIFVGAAAGRISTVGAFFSVEASGIPTICAPLEIFFERIKYFSPAGNIIPESTSSDVEIYFVFARRFFCSAPKILTSISFPYEALIRLTPSAMFSEEKIRPCIEGRTNFRATTVEEGSSADSLICPDNRLSQTSRLFFRAVFFGFSLNDLFPKEEHKNRSSYTLTKTLILHAIEMQYWKQTP